MEYYDKISKQLDDLFEHGLKYPNTAKTFATRIRIAAIAEDREMIKELARAWVEYEKP